MVGRRDEICEDHIAPDFPVESCKTTTGAALPGTEPKPAVRQFLARERDDGTAGAAGCGVLTT